MPTDAVARVGDHRAGGARGCRSARGASGCAGRRASPSRSGTSVQHDRVGDEGDAVRALVLQRLAVQAHAQLEVLADRVGREAADLDHARRGGTRRRRPEMMSSELIALQPGARRRGRRAGTRRSGTSRRDCAGSPTFETWPCSIRQPLATRMIPPAATVTPGCSTNGRTADSRPSGSSSESASTQQMSGLARDVDRRVEAVRAPAVDLVDDDQAAVRARAVDAADVRGRDARADRLVDAAQAERVDQALERVVLGAVVAERDLVVGVLQA